MRQATINVLGWTLAALTCFALVRQWSPVRVAGRSMEPALYAGDLVLVASTRDVRRGDIALLKRPGTGPVLHRIREVGQGGAVQAQGDANPVPDLALYARSSVRGRVVRVLPVGRMLAWWHRR